MQLNKVSTIWTLAHVATELGEDEDWLFGIIGEMEPEDGVVIIPFLSGLFPGLHAASFSFMAGVIPPMPILGR